MIDLLTKSLVKLLDDANAIRFPELAAAVISPDPPGTNVTGEQVHLFLFDIRENVELRNVTPRVQKHATKVRTTPAPRRVACSYLVTAHTSTTTDATLVEQKLLAQAFQLLSETPVLLPAFLQGGLVHKHPRPPLSVGLPDQWSSPFEVWNALQLKMRPTFYLTATVPVEDAVPSSVEEFQVLEAGNKIVSGIRKPKLAGGKDELIAGSRMGGYPVAGFVSDSGGTPLAGVTIEVQEIGPRVLSKADGAFHLGILPDGGHELAITSSSGTTTTVNIQVPNNDYNLTIS